jgi:hypothetical protein
MNLEHTAMDVIMPRARYTSVGTRTAEANEVNSLVKDFDIGAEVLRKVGAERL